MIARIPKLGLMAGFLLVCMAVAAQTVPNVDILGSHDLGSGVGGVRGQNANACIYCHAPHNALSAVPLWNQTLSTKQYNLYSNPTVTTSVSKASMLCLSCHDGSVAVGQTISMGTLQVSGTVNSIGGSQLATSHPFSIQPQIEDSPTLVATLAASHTTSDPAVSLIDKNVECGTCHDVHNQYHDPKFPEFLVRTNHKSQLCLACHTTAIRNVGGSENPLDLWSTSIHATSANEVSLRANLAGSYTQVADVGCSSCHVSHNGLTTGLVRKNPNRPLNVDDTSQACLICHDGSDTLASRLLNIDAEFQKAGQYAHPFADSTNQHGLNEPVVLDRNRHTTCVDCHQPHAASPTSTFEPLPTLRPSQAGVAGVAMDGTVLPRAINQYENCLRCHGPGPEKNPVGNYGYLPSRTLFAGDQYDVSKQFANALSSHAVMRQELNDKRPDLLDNIWDVYFKNPVRPVTGQILCTDCHNSDDNREFGGTGPNGAHGSQFEHVLERRYVMSRASAGPGSLISNLQSPPDLSYSPLAPYAMCAKCHRMEYINSSASWAEHARHIQDGFSCSVCHSAHGVPNGTVGVPGTGLVTFDMNVVAPNNGVVSWNGGTSCTLTCHQHTHN